MIALDFSRPIIMGILNVTPDSFSDGGQYQNVDAAIKHALQMVQEGVDIIDVGGESTRPGSQRIKADEQIKRALPVIQALKNEIPEKVLISIDTTLAEVACDALDAGASIINDISAGRDDPEIMKLAAKKQCPYILMHMQGEPGNMQNNPVYGDVVEEIRSFLIERAQVATNAGIKKENIIIDPGIGFGKTKEHNLELMVNLRRFVDTGYPVLLGTSRKRFMGSICASATADQLIGATCATTAIGVFAGVKIFRVHDVRENRQAADVAWTILNSDPVS
jgi:dihydropteroate synthase